MIGYEVQYLRAGKVLEEIVSGGPWCASPDDAEYQLYQAVVDRAVAARLDGTPVLDTSWIRRQRWSDTSMWALPADLELKLEDARRIWNWVEWDLKDAIALGRINPAIAIMRVETILLNMRVLLEKLDGLLADRSLVKAMKDMDFNSRWGKFSGDLSILLGVRGIPVTITQNILIEIAYINEIKRGCLARTGRKKSMGGRASVWDWSDVYAHIHDLFELNGPLSKDDPKWSSQVHVENAIKAYCLKTTGREPSTSVARQRAKEFIAEYLRVKSSRGLEPISD